MAALNFNWQQYRQIWIEVELPCACGIRHVPRPFPSLEPHLAILLLNCEFLERLKPAFI